MHVLQLPGVKAYETEIELLHLRDVPLQRFKYHVVAGGNVHRTAQALLRADQYSVDCGVEFRHDALPFLEGDIALDHEYRPFGETFAETVFVKLECRYGGAADGDLAGNPPYQSFDVLCLVRNSVTVIAFYQMGNGAGFDKQLDLPHKPESGILLRVSSAVIVKFADAAELLDDDTVNLTLSSGRADGVCPYLVLLTGEVPELAGDDCLSDKFRQFLLVIYILVLFLYAEHGGFSRTVAGTEKHMPSECRERFAVMGIVFLFYLLVPVLVVHQSAPANHVYGIVVQQLELAVQFRDVVSGGRAGIEYLVLEAAEETEDVPCPL